MTVSLTSRRFMAAALLVAGSVMLSGCSSVVDHVPTWAGGLPEGVPERPAKAQAYPPVHEMPPARGDVALSDAERKRLLQDLAKTRARNEEAAKETTGSTDGTTRNP